MQPATFAYSVSFPLRGGDRIETKLLATRSPVAERHYSSGGSVYDRAKTAAEQGRQSRNGSLLALTSPAIGLAKDVPPRSEPAP